MDSMSREDRKLGAAILGMFAAISLCRELGYDPRDIFELMNDDERCEQIAGRRIYESTKPTGSE